MSPTLALDKFSGEGFVESRYGVLLKASEDFLFTMANWLNLMTNLEYLDLAITDALALQDQDTAAQALRAISRTFVRTASPRRDLFGRPPLYAMVSENVKNGMAEDQVYKIISAIQRCMSPSPTHPCLTCGTSSAHTSDDAMQHFMQTALNQGIGLNHIIDILYGCTVNRSMFRTSALDRCPGHFGFGGGQPRPGDKIVLLPGSVDPIIVRRRPGSNGTDYYRIVGLASGIVRQSVSEKRPDDDPGNFCSSFCKILDDTDAASHHKPQTFYLL